MTTDRTNTERLAGTINGAILLLGLILIGQFTYSVLGYGRDNSDPPDGRSGLGVYTDSATGCEYLSIRSTGLVPRMSAGGVHRGCRVVP